MRTVTLAALLLIWSVPIYADPGDAEEAALASRVRTLLASEAIRDRAWGAYLAGKHGIRAVAPTLTEGLTERAEADGREAHAVRMAALDALIRLDVRPDLPTCEGLMRNGTGPVLILLAGHGPAAEPIVRPLLRQAEGMGPLCGRALRMLLAEWRSPHLAADLLRELTLPIEVVVLSHGVGGGCSGSFERSCGYVELIPSLPGWPPAVRYVFTEHATPGAVLLAPGPQPIYYRRVEVARGDDGAHVAGRGPRDSPAAFKLRCLAHLMRSEIKKTWGMAPKASLSVPYENDEKYLEAIRDAQDRIRANHARLVRHLVSVDLLTEEEAPELRLKLEIRVIDLRPDNQRTELPPT